MTRYVSLSLALYVDPDGGSITGVKAQMTGEHLKNKLEELISIAFHRFVIRFVLLLFFKTTLTTICRHKWTNRDLAKDTKVHNCVCMLV
jgi:hypothetical protein